MESTKDIQKEKYKKATFYIDKIYWIIQMQALNKTFDIIQYI